MSRYRGVGPFRQVMRIKWDHPDFSVRSASLEDILRVQRDNVEHRLSTRWTSEEALLRQMAIDTQTFICPIYRNGGLEADPESYKCWMWYFSTSREQMRAVSLLDVRKELFASLAEVAQPSDLRRVIVMMMEGSVEGSQFESLT